METTITTKLYAVPVCVETKEKGQSKFTMFQCYGMEKIAESAAPPDTVQGSI